MTELDACSSHSSAPCAAAVSPLAAVDSHHRHATVAETSLASSLPRLQRRRQYVHLHRSPVSLFHSLASSPASRTKSVARRDGVRAVQSKKGVNQVVIGVRIDNMSISTCPEF
ncbi:unnamed protein product [Urochloa humidicola]